VGRVRSRFLSITCIVTGAILLYLGTIAVWTRIALFDPEGFTERADSALENEPVRELLADEIVDQIIAHGSSRIITVRPLVEFAVSEVAESRPFRAVFRRAARQAHASIFSGDEGIVLPLVDVMIVVSGALESLDPGLADRLPQVRSILIEFRELKFAQSLLEFARALRRMAWGLPLLALALYALAIWLAPSRHEALVKGAFSLSVVGIVMIIGVALGRAAIAGTIEDPVERQAVIGVWRAYVSDLWRWGIAAAVFGTALSAAMTSALKPTGVRSGLAYMRERLHWAPETDWGRALRGCVLVLASWGMLKWPGELVELAVVVAGLLVLYVGLIELARAAGLDRAAEGEQVAAHKFVTRVWSQTARYAVVTAVLLGIGLGALALVLRSEDEGLLPFSGPILSCNGSPVLCDRPFNEVAIPATHNSMSAASERGWFFASHEEGIADQLRFGVRGFLIDTYYGVPVERGVRTDVFHDRDRSALTEEFGEEFVEAYERIAPTLGLEEGDERQLYMCHAFCELGATKLSGALTEIRKFLEQNPGEIVVIVNQDAVPAADVVRVFEEIGLDGYAFAHRAGSSWPTMRQMIESGKRLLVMAENDGSGPDWYHGAFELTQETPYKFITPADFSCRENRGRADSPLFLVNHWIEKVTPSLADAEQVNRFDVLLKRVVDCQTERQRVPNLVAVNFYSRGDLLQVVDALNGIR
jgi:hypothetical protein